MLEKKEYGFCVTLTEHQFNHIIAEALGLQAGSIEVVQVSSNLVWRGISLTIMSKDTSHPALREGCFPAQAMLEVAVVDVPNSKYHTRQEKVVGVHFTSETNC